MADPADMVAEAAVRAAGSMGNNGSQFVIRLMASVIVGLSLIVVGVMMWGAAYLIDSDKNHEKHLSNIDVSMQRQADAQEASLKQNSSDMASLRRNVGCIDQRQNWLIGYSFPNTLELEKRSRTHEYRPLPDCNERTN